MSYNLPMVLGRGFEPMLQQTLDGTEGPLDDEAQMDDWMTEKQ